MASRTYAVHTTDENISRIDEWAERLRRSRNSLINEAIEMLLEHYDSDTLKRLPKVTNHNRKAGTR